jgi:hypothetical protein
MAFDFPSAPALDDVYNDATSGKSYVYDGEKWQAQGGGGTTQPPASAYNFNIGLTLQADGITVDLDAATNVLLGGLLEPPPDGQPYARQNDAGVITWVPATATTRPALTSIDPVLLGTSDPATTLTVTGTGFTAASEIRINVFPMPTTFVSETEVTTPLDPAALGMGNYAVTVNTAGQSSMPLTLNIIDNPTLVSISPTSAAAGSGQITLSLVGTVFTTAAYCETAFSLDGVDQASTNINTPTTGQVYITPKATPGTTEVQVHNGTVLATTPPILFTST